MMSSALVDRFHFYSPLIKALWHCRHGLHFSNSQRNVRHIQNSQKLAYSQYSRAYRTRIPLSADDLDLVDNHVRRAKHCQ